MVLSASVSSLHVWGLSLSLSLSLSIFLVNKTTANVSGNLRGTKSHEVFLSRTLTGHRERPHRLSTAAFWEGGSHCSSVVLCKSSFGIILLLMLVLVCSSSSNWPELVAGNIAHECSTVIFVFL